MPATDLPAEHQETDRGSGSGSKWVASLHVADAALGIGLVALAVLAIRLGRGFSFIVDEWDILAHHVHGDLLTPYNGHLSIVPIMIYQGLAHTVGIGSYRPYGLVALGVFLAIPVALYVTHRRHVAPVLGVIAALAIAWSWAAEGNVLYGFLINFDLPILMLIVAWALIRRGTLRHDVWAVAAVTVALATSSVGVVVAFAIGIELIIERVPLRRLIRFAPPVMLWAVWWFFGHDPTKPASIADRAAYAWHVSVAILAGFTFGWKPGAVLSAAAIIALSVVAWRRWGTVDAHVVATLLALGFFVVLSAYSRAGDLALNPPDSPRYVWVGDVLIIAALLWCCRGRTLRVLPTCAVGAVVVLGAIGLVGHLRDYRTYVLDYTARTRPFLVAAEAAGPNADRVRILPLNLIPVTVGEYLDLVDAVGSPVHGLDFGSLGSEASRHAADRVLLAEDAVRLAEVGTLPACATHWRAGEGRVFALDPGSRLAVATEHHSEIRIRRLARTFPQAADLQIGPGRIGLISTTRDTSSLPWSIRVDGDLGSVQVCDAS